LNALLVKLFASGDGVSDVSKLPFHVTLMDFVRFGTRCRITVTIEVEEPKWRG